MSVHYGKSTNSQRTQSAVTRPARWLGNAWWLIALIGGGGVCYVTALVMIQPVAASSAVRPTVPALRPAVANPRALSATFAAQPAEQPNQRGLDVLGRLAASGSGVYMARSAGQSNSLAEALRRALAFPSFSALATRTDAEGLFEAAAWIQACSGGRIAPDDSRCNEWQLRDPAYGDRLQLNAAAAGHPGAITDWIERHPAIWAETPLPGGEILTDRVLTMAAHGDFAAIQSLYYFCSQPNACVDGRLVQYVLGLLWMKNHPGSLPQPQIPADQEGLFRKASARADELSRSLPAWDQEKPMAQYGRS